MPLFNFLRLDSPPRRDPSPAPAPRPAAPPPQPNQNSSNKPKEKPLSEVENAVREVNEAIVAITTLESSSQHPAHELIAKAARRSLRDVGAFLDRLRRRKTF